MATTNSTGEIILEHSAQEIDNLLNKVTPATTSSDGLMTASDKSSLDTLSGADCLYGRNTDIHYDGELPTLCGQPMILFASGTPADGNVPYNWNSYDKDSGAGYEWTGVPHTLGQRYVDVTGGAEYIAVRTSWDITQASYNTLKWMQL